MTGRDRRPLRGHWGRAVWGGVLSLVCPGSGQIYARRWRLGVGLFGLGIALWVCMFALTRTVAPEPPAFLVFLFLVILQLALKIGAGVDAMRRLRLGPDPLRPHWVKSTWFAA